MNDQLMHETDAIYTNVIKTQDEALCHLFFHCCFKDGDFKPTEIDYVAERFVKLGLNGKLNFKDEVVKHRSFHHNIQDDTTFVEYLVDLIKPANELALYSYCCEIVLSDSSLDPSEESLLQKIGNALDIGESSQETIKNMAVQRKAVEIQKII